MSSGVSSSLIPLDHWWCPWYTIASPRAVIIIIGFSAKGLRPVMPGLPGLLVGAICTGWRVANFADMDIS